MSTSIRLVRQTLTSFAFSGGQLGSQTLLRSPAVAESAFTASQSRRYIPEAVKRFYLDATVERSPNGGFEIHLDRKPLKTPSKQTLNIQDERLAAAVAAEWCAQKKVIQPHQMHLTALCNTVQDNPLRKAKEELIHHVVSSLEYDTILHRAEDNEKLMSLQKQKWEPIREWFEEEFKVPLPLAVNLMPPAIPQETRDAIANYLSNYSLEAIQGLVFGADSIKSVVLTLATVMDRLTPKEAVHLSRLETEYQEENWGYVEWHHEVELFDSIARLSAATLFFDSHAEPF